MRTHQLCHRTVFGGGGARFCVPSTDGPFGRECEEGALPCDFKPVVAEVGSFVFGRLKPTSSRVVG